jgi:hypothetical protein
VKGKRDSGDGFERRLLDELKAVVAERGAEQEAAGGGARSTPAWRRAPRLALGAVAVLAAAVAVLVFSSGGENTPRAFAVEPQEGGGVRIKVYSLEDAAGLEQALEDAGIRAQVTWLPAGTSCREPRFKPSSVKLPGGGTLAGFDMGGPDALTISVGSTKRWRERFGEHRRGEISDKEYYGSLANLNLDPAAFRPNQSVVLSGSPAPFGGDPEGGSKAQVRVAEGPVKPCEPVEGLVHPTGAPALAKASDAPAEAPPGPGEFLYAKTRVVQLQGWEPEGRGAGTRAKPRHFTANLLGSESKALPALVPTTKEVWTAPDGRTRVRETLGRVAFLWGEDQRRWEAAGSPPPFEYDPAEHHVGRDGSGRPMKEFASRSWRGSHVFADVAKLSAAPTDPEALRLEIEHRRGGGDVTIERLMEILGEPITSPGLRAAAFNALAEIPGVELERHAVDVTGRRGAAVSWGSEGERSAYRREFIIDPRTSRLLAQAEVIDHPKAAEMPGIPPGTVFRETAYLQSGIVDSIRETVADRNGDPVATASRGRGK